jgi:hypothetical protein
MRWRAKWLHVTRAAGLAGLAYEVVWDKVDRPSLMIVLGAMILGTESVSRIFGKGQ